MNIDTELKKHKFIVLSADHYNPLGVVRSLGEMGLDPICIVHSKQLYLLNHCKYVKKLHHVNGIAEGYELLLKEYGNEKEKPFVYCSDDHTQSYLDAHYDELKGKFYCYNAGEEHGRLIWLQNKDNITNLGAESGLFCPKKEVVDKGVLPKTLKYPIITKVLASTMGAWKGDVYICKNEKELLEAYKKIYAEKLILQEYIFKKGEFCMEGFAINDGKDVFIPYQFDYVRTYANSFGHYMNVNPFTNEDFKARILDLFKKTKYNGIFEIEFMRGPNDESYFLEINFRASTWNYAVTVGGGNMPYLWAKSMLLGRIPIEEIHLRRETFHAMEEFTDLFTNVFRLRTVAFSDWLKEFRSTECCYYYNKNDIIPYVFAWFHKIKTLFRHKVLHIK